jgi:hypothetical protein
MLVEKRLGVGESILLRKNSLFMFEKSVYFHNDTKPEYKNEYFVAEGPGFLVFEMNHTFTKRQKAVKSINFLIIILFIISIISSIPYILLNDINLE